MNQSNSPRDGGIPVFLTKSEYRILVQTTYQQLFMLESLVEQHNSKDFEKLNALTSKLLTYANEFASEDLVATDVMNSTVYPNSIFIERVMEAIADYDEVSFWEELTHKLAERDLLRELDASTLDTMPEEDYLEALSEKLVYYTNRFGEEGLENLNLNS